MAHILEKNLQSSQIDPFLRRIVAQDGTVKNDGTHHFLPEQRLHMDWLCDNVIGTIPEFSEIIPVAEKMVRQLGIYRDRIPPEKEGKPREDFDRIR